MDEAEALADHVAVIAGGRIVAEGTPASLADRQHMRTRISFVLPSGVQPGVAAEHVDGHWRIETDAATHVLADLTSWAVGAGVDLEGLHVAPPTLEDVYLALTGQPSDQPAADAEAPAGRGRRGRRRR
jgi:ABC-2 type transport system ATP-binding protein